MAADSIQNYEARLLALPEHERPLFDLDLDDRWGDEAPVQRFMNRVLFDAFEGEHFTVVTGAGHLYIEGLYLIIPTYSFRIADADGEVVDFYSAPKGFEQPIHIEARIQVNRPSLIPEL